MYLRLAEPDELDIVYLMGFDVWGDGLSLDEYLSCCRSNGKYSKGTWYVLVEKEQVVSALIVYSGTFGLQKGCFGLGSIATHPQLRHKGYASKLIHLVKRGYSRVSIVKLYTCIAISASSFIIDLGLSALKVLIVCILRMMTRSSKARCRTTSRFYYQT